jgi:chemotaxis protein MotB
MSKKGHGHHGGAWKVAYADFVTAMMALFLTLWLVNQDQKIKDAVERAFRAPLMSVTDASSGVMPSRTKQAGRADIGRHEGGTTKPHDPTPLRRLKDNLAKSLDLREVTEEEEPVKVEPTQEGLRINIFDRARKPIFEKDSSQLTEYGEWILTTLAWEISRQTGFTLELEGHTDKGQLAASPNRPAYGDWELTADRANASRRKLINHGVSPAQIRRVTGYADTAPLDGHPPEDPVNRRITLRLRAPTQEEPTKP